MSKIKELLEVCEFCQGNAEECGCELCPFCDTWYDYINDVPRHDLVCDGDPCPSYTEAQARYWGRKAGWRIAKARGRLHINNLGGFQVIDGTNTVIAGVDFDWTAAQVVEFAKQHLGGGK